MTTLRHAHLGGLVVTVALGMLCAPVLSAPVLIGAGYDWTGNEGKIYDVDPVTGAATNPRETGIRYLSGIAFSADGTLYARTASWGPDAYSLFRVDPYSGDSTLVGFIGKSGGDIDFDPDTGFLYAGHHLGGGSYSELFTIDPASATPTSIGSCLGWLGSLAFSSTGELYALDANDMRLLTLDKHNGSILHDIPLAGASTIDGMEFLPDGTALVTGDDALGVWHLYTLDLGTGVMTPRGPTGLDQDLALAFLPEPEAIVFLSFGIAALLGKRKRQPVGFVPDARP